MRESLETRRPRRRLAAPMTALCLVAAAVSPACYTYLPATLDAVPAGTKIRALLSTEAQLALRDGLGLRQQTVQGTLVDRSGDQVLLEVRGDDTAGRTGSHPLYQRVAVAQRDILEIEVKQLHRGRTYGLLATLAAAATAATLEVTRRGNPGTPGAPGGGPPE